MERKKGKPKKGSVSWDTHAPAKGLVLGEFTKSASDYKDSSLRSKGKKKAKEKHIYFKELLSEWRKSSLIALILSLRETTRKEKRKQDSEYGLLLRASLGVFIGCSKYILQLWSIQWGLTSFRLEGQAVDSGPHSGFLSERAGLKSPWPLVSSEFRNKLGFFPKTLVCVPLVNTVWFVLPLEEKSSSKSWWKAFLHIGFFKTTLWWVKCKQIRIRWITFSL